MQEEAEKSILIAAKLISPVIEDNYTSGTTGTSRLLTRSFCRKEDNVIILFLGYNWCLEAVKTSKYASLASDLDLDKAIMLLKQCNINGAIEILKVFQDKEPRVASIAANNLSFISYLVKS